MSNIVEVSGLNKSYKDFSLTDVSFTFFVFSLGPMLITNLLADIDFSMLIESAAAIPDMVKCITLALLSALSFTASMAISMRIFANKEL